MRVLDTNVVAEMMAATPDPAVLAYLDALDEPPALTVVTVAELQFGIRLLADGERKRRLAGAAARLTTAFGERGVLAFDSPCAHQYATVTADRRQRGRPISQFDAVIAAICRVHGAELVTRNVADFEHTGIAVTNPWDAA